MVLVKKCHFLRYLFSVKISLPKRVYNGLDTKQSFFGHKKFTLSKFQKSHFSKGVNPYFGQKTPFFFYLFSVKIKEKRKIRVNNVLDTKQTFYGHKKFNISKSHKSYFSKGVNPCFGQKLPFFYVFVFGQNKTLKKV